LFAIAFRRLVLDTELFEINRYFVEIAHEKGFYSKGLLEEVMKKGNLKGVKDVPPNVRRLFKTSFEIPPIGYIEMQVAFQEYTDNAVSKTINYPQRAKEEDVAEAYRTAYAKGVKGITVFRYGAKKGTLVKFSDDD